MLAKCSHTFARKIIKEVKEYGGGIDPSLKEKEKSNWSMVKIYDGNVIILSRP
jgi:hypothetical protein